MESFIMGVIVAGIMIAVCDNKSKLGKFFLGILAFISYLGCDVVYGRIDRLGEPWLLCMFILSGFPVVAIYYYLEYLSLKEYCKKKKYDLSGYEWLKKNVD